MTWFYLLDCEDDTFVIVKENDLENYKDVVLNGPAKVKWEGNLVNATCVSIAEDKPRLVALQSDLAKRRRGEHLLKRGKQVSNTTRSGRTVLPASLPWTEESTTATEDDHWMMPPPQKQVLPSPKLPAFPDVRSVWRSSTPTSASKSTSKSHRSRSRSTSSSKSMTKSHRNKFRSTSASRSTSKSHRKSRSTLAYKSICKSNRSKSRSTSASRSTSKSNRSKSRSSSASRSTHSSKSRSSSVFNSHNSTPISRTTLRDGDGRFAPNMEELVGKANAFLHCQGSNLKSIEGLSHLMLLMQYQVASNHAAAMAKISSLQHEVRVLKDRGNIREESASRPRHSILSRIPIANSEEFRNFSLDASARQALVTHLSEVGGNTVKVTVYGVLNKLLDSSFSKNLVATDAGAARSGKLSFMKLQSVVVDAVLRTEIPEESASGKSAYSIIKHITRFFHNAADRNGGKTLRKRNLLVARSDASKRVCSRSRSVSV